MHRKFIFIFSCFFLFASCGDQQTPLFDIEFTVDLDIPTGLNTIETHFFPINQVQTFYSSFAGEIPDDMVASILPSSCSIDGRFTSIDYDFIQDIFITAADPTNPTVKSEIFFREDIPLGNSGELVLFGNLRDAKEFIINDLVNLEVRMKLRNFPPGNIENRLTLRFQAFEAE
jgi:hypothetical protein